MTTTTPFSIDDTPDSGIPRPPLPAGATHPMVPRQRVRLRADPTVRIDRTGAAPIRSWRLDEPCIRWTHLVAVCAVGAAAWALVIGGGWYVAHRLIHAPPTVAVLDD